jgi:osmotically-inducible protein OsmY
MRGLVILVVATALFGVAGCATPRGPAAGLDNASASMAIKSRMLRSQTSFAGVDVRVVDGVALLMGHVPTEEAKAEAERIAWSAPNVRDVGNELNVDPRGRTLLGANDQLLLTEVRTRLIHDRLVRASSVHVEVYDGVVYLLGRVRTASEIQRAAAITSRTAGVKRVVSYLSAEEGGPIPAVGRPLRDEPYEPEIRGPDEPISERLLGAPE